MQAAFVVFIGSGIGGLCRHVLNGWITALAGPGFPYGILAINILGSTAMGVVAGWFAFRGESAGDLRLFLATGVLGGFTTFSAFSLDTALLIERGDTALAMVYVAASVLFSVLGLFFALWTARLLFA